MADKAPGAPRGHLTGAGWPAFRYHPVTGQGAVFNAPEDVPDGWHDGSHGHGAPVPQDHGLALAQRSAELAKQGQELDRRSEELNDREAELMRREREIEARESDAESREQQVSSDEKPTEVVEKAAPPKTNPKTLKAPAKDAPFGNPKDKE